MKVEQNVPKCRHIKFRHRGITQKKAYNRHITHCTGGWVGLREVQMNAEYLISTRGIRTLPYWIPENVFWKHCSCHSTF